MSASTPNIAVEPGARQPLHVMAGVIADAHGRILIARRPEHVHQGGRWEFPGGKREPDETPEACLARELHEELGIAIEASAPLIRVPHDDGERSVLLDVRRVLAYRGTPGGREGQPLQWRHPRDMDPSLFPVADRPIIAALRLPATLLITGAGARSVPALLDRLRRALGRGIALVQLRAHDWPDDDYARLADAVFALCERQGARVLLNRDPLTCAHLPRHGWHLTAARLSALAARPGTPEDLIGASCHDARELARAVTLGADFALLSPVRATASHPQATPLGWAGFAALVDPVPLPVYALGGLREADLDTAIAHGAQGIAGIGAWREAAG